MEQEMRVCKCCGRELPIEQFSKNAWGYTHTCKECCIENNKKSREEKKRLKQQAVDAVNARNLRLQDFQPRELMKRLKELGYEGELIYTKVERIDIGKL